MRSRANTQTDVNLTKPIQPSTPAWGEPWANRIKPTGRGHMGVERDLPRSRQIVVQIPFTKQVVYSPVPLPYHLEFSIPH